MKKIGTCLLSQHPLLNYGKLSPIFIYGKICIYFLFHSKHVYLLHAIFDYHNQVMFVHHQMPSLTLLFCSKFHILSYEVKCVSWSNIPYSLTLKKTVYIVLRIKIIIMTNRGNQNKQS